MVTYGHTVLLCTSSVLELDATIKEVGFYRLQTEHQRKDVQSLELNNDRKTHTVA
jgi:hypothetical protein